MRFRLVFRATTLNDLERPIHAFWSLSQEFNLKKKQILATNV